MYRRIPLSMLSEGFILASAVHDDSLRMLLGAGVEITTVLMTALYKRGVRDVVVAEKDWQRLTAFSSIGRARKAAPRHSAVQSDLHLQSTLLLDDEVADYTAGDIVPSEEPFSDRVQRKGAVSYVREDMDCMVEHHQQSVEQVRGLLEQLNQNQSVSGEAVQAITEAALKRAEHDLDLFVCMGINPNEQSDAHAHAANVATLAVALGVTLGQDEAVLRDLGAGCLVHNAGMTHIDPRVALSPEFLSERDFVEITKHPVIATDMLYNNMSRVPLGVRMIVYQMHERCDGSGYPRGRTAESIHPLAKIAAVADAYVALVSKRPYRPAMLPYYAMAKMLEDVKAGLYDATAVRALLHTVSLFPIGSYSELSDGRVAKTIRANGPAYDRPIVEAWDRARLKDAPAVLDLTDEASPRVVKPLAFLR